MDKFSMESHCLVSSGSFGLDELCNFERDRMYASVDMHQGPITLSVQEESACHAVQGIAERETVETYPDALNDDDAIMEDVVSESNSMGPIEMSDENFQKKQIELKRMTPGFSPSCSRKSRLSSASSASSKRIRLQNSPQQSSHSSHRIRHSGSVLNEEDADDLEDEITSRCVILTDKSDSIFFKPENIIMCINAGGSSIMDTSLGADFLEDSHFLGGDVLRTEETIANSQDPVIYQTARYGNFSYFLNDIPAGDYMVDLHFAEIIFTNGPSGLRVFDVLIQDQKVIAGLDVFSLVGSNTPLIIMNIRASVKEKGLSICFQGIAGSPSLCGICIRKPESEVPVQYVGQLHKKTVFDTQEVPNDTKESHHSVMKTLEVLESSKTKVKERQNDRQKGKTRKCIQEYELKIEELKNEVHQAWLSVQDANRKNEKLQSELDCRSLHVDSLAQAVERQLYYLNDMKEQTERDKREWQSKMLQIAGEYQLLKADYLHLAKEAHEWVNSFPAIDSMTMKVQALVDELQDLKKKFVKQGQDLRLYYNQVLELKGNIRVFCRCRPLSAAEISMGAASIVEFDSTRDNELVICSNGAKKTFKFDRVFSPSNGQSDVFSDTAPVVVSVLDGYNVCIFAYGQTGTGKTYTMEGNVNDRGVNYRTLEELFQLTEKRKGQYAYTISVSVLEVYNEQIRDLLAQPLPPGQCARKLEIKQVTEGVHHVPGLTEATVQCIEEVWDVLQTGSRARAIGSTNANEHSSRSHCMLCVMVKGESLLTAECTRSKLWLVDLAGSERVAKTDVQGERLKEAQNINKSLSALGDVIHALATKSSHVPYRNSKLTHLLQDSLGGESKTLMFVQISPSELDAGETICSLNFASRVRGVELGIARKQLESADTVKYKQLTERLKQDGKLKDEALRKQDETLKAKEQALRALTEKVKESEKSRSTAESKVKEQQSLIEKLREDLKTNDSLKSMQAKEIEKARSVTECKLKEQHSLIEKLKEELKLNKSMEKDSTTERKLKEQQILIEKLQEELKSKDNVRPKSPAHVMEENLRQPLSNLMKEDNSQLEIASESSAMDICETAFIEVDEPSTKRATTTNVSPGKTRRISSKCNGPFPAMEKKATGRSGRFSMAGGNLKIAPSVPSHHPPLPPAAEAFTADGMDSTRSSCDSFEDSYADENVVPHLQQSIVVSVVSSPKSVGWKKGTAIAPSTVLRRSIPRKIHFKSPHLQPSYLKGSMQAASSSLPVADKESSQTAGAERILAVQNKRDRPEGVSKTRRISSMHPPWNGSTTVGSKGRAQRIPISNASKTPSSHRERAWNR